MVAAFALKPVNMLMFLRIMAVSIPGIMSILIEINRSSNIYDNLSLLFFHFLISIKLLLLENTNLLEFLNACLLFLFIYINLYNVLSLI